jgi:hypothetical protein
MEDEKALQPRALICELVDAVEGEVDDLLADGVVAARVVVCGVLLAVNQMLRVKELPVRASADLLDHRRLEVDEERARDVLARARSCWNTKIQNSFCDFNNSQKKNITTKQLKKLKIIKGLSISFILSSQFVTGSKIALKN